MAKAGINLIPGEEKYSFEILDILRKLRYYTLVFFTFFVVFLLILFLLFLKSSSEINQISQRVSLTEKKIKSLQSVEENLFLIKNRLFLAKEILKEQTKKVEILSRLKGISPEGILFESVESGERGGLEITISSSNLFSIYQFIEKISQPEFKKDFKQIQISSISRSGDGNFRFGLSCAF